MWTVLLGILLLLSKSHLVCVVLMAGCWISCLYYSQSHVLLFYSFTFLHRHAGLWAGLWFIVNIFNPKSTLCDCNPHNAFLFIVHFSNCILKCFNREMKETRVNVKEIAKTNLLSGENNRKFTNGTFLCELSMVIISGSKSLMFRRQDISYIAINLQYHQTSSIIH